MYNSQYYTCEQIDQRLLQGYLDDYNTETGQSLTKAEFLIKLRNAIDNFVNEGEVKDLIESYVFHGDMYGGLAIPSGSPQLPDDNQAPLFFIAISPGTYTNYGNLTISKPGFHIILWDTDTWSVQQNILEIEQVLGESTVKLLSQKAITDFLSLTADSNVKAQIGYYECDTAAGTAAKVLSVASYALFVGGSMKVKFANKNTANNATLNINSQGAKALYYQGERASATNSWDANEVVDIYYDGTSYYAHNVNSGSGSGSGVYDVSKEHPTSGPNGDGKFTLEYILNSSNVNELIPVNKRYPGMSIQFVSTSDNKYVQYRYMETDATTAATFTNIANWQGVDDEPTVGSDNLITSGGVYVPLHNLDKQINGGNEEYDADIQTTSATYVRPAVHYADVNIPAGIYNVGIELNGVIAVCVMYFYDSNGDQITGILNKNGTSYNFISSGSSILSKNPFTFPKEIKRIGLYGDNKITDGTIEVSLSTESETGIVGEIANIAREITNIEEELEGKADKTDIDNIEEVVFGNNNSNSFSVLFKANVPIDALGSQYPTNFNLKAGTYILSAPKPSPISDVPIFIYFYDENNNVIVVTDNIGATYNNMSLPPYDSRQPFTFPTDVDHVNFYGGTPSVDATLVFKATDVNGDKNVRELAEEAMVDAPEVVFPRKLYLLSSNSEKVENSIYHKHYMSYQNPIYAMDISRGFGWRYTSRCFRVDAQGPIQNPTMYLRNIPKHTTVGTFTPSVVTGMKGTDNGRKVINVIGDSFTYNGTWYNEINNLCPNLAFVGMRQSYDAADTLKAEGRGGWKLSDYFEPHSDVTPTHMQPFSPFMHVDGYTYYGVIDFWKVIVNDNSQYTYGTDGFETYKSWFDTDGYKINPPTNALMYDGVNDKYVYYNGSSWADFNGTPTFVFDYSKYISTWNIESPDFVMVLLGTNDFGNNSVVSDADWDLWKERIDILITSVRAYGTSVGKTITIGLCTPTVRYGADNGSYGVNQDFYAAGTYSGRKHIIDAFDTDTYEGMNVFVVDTGTAVDTEYGWMEWDTAINEKPFAYYEGTFREFYGYNEPHPSNAGYKQIGVVGAAFIQAKR